MDVIQLMCPRPNEDSCKDPLVSRSWPDGIYAVLVAGRIVSNAVAENIKDCFKIRSLPGLTVDQAAGMKISKSEYRETNSNARTGLPVRGNVKCDYCL
jgi:hypothetical protein